MYYLSKLCLLCLNYKELESVLMQDDNGIVVQQKLQYCLPEITMLETKIPEFICSSCRRTVHTFYEFKKTCLENYSLLMQYTQTLQGSSDPRGQQFSELQIQIKKQKLLMELVPDSQLNDDIEFDDEYKVNNEEDEVSLPLNEHEELQDQMNNRELIAEQEQEVNNELKIEVEEEVLLKPLEKYEEKPISFDTVYIEENIIAPENNKEDEFHKIHINYERVFNNEPDSTARSSCEDNNQLMMDEPNCSVDSDNENGTCNKRDTGSTNFKCTVCNIYFLKQQYLTDHMKIHKNIRDFKCQICGIDYERRWNLVRHLKIHAGRNKVSVPLKEHEELQSQIDNPDLVRKRQQEEDRKRKMEIYNKVLLQSLKEHKEKPVDTVYVQENIIAPKNNEKHKFNEKRMKYKRVCDNKQSNTARNSCKDDNRLIVDKAKFSANSENVNAICNKTHSGTKEFRRTNYKCTICKKYFLRNRYLTIHMKIHKNIRDFKCEICGMAFVHSTTLKRHLKIHERRNEALLRLKQHEELLDQLNIRELIKDRKQEVNNEREIEVEHDVTLPLKEHEELQDKMNNRELKGDQEQGVNNELKIEVEDEVSLLLKQHEELLDQMNNRELIAEEEQEVNNGLKIEVEEEVLLKPLQKYKEKPVSFDAVYIAENIIASEKNEEHEFNKKHINYERVSANEQGSTSRSSCKYDNLLVVSESNSTCNNNNTGTKEFTHTNFKCTVCHKYLLNKRYLNYHLTMHNNKRKNKCHLCGKEFLWKSHLNRHLKVHAKIESLKCTICDRNFAREGSLETHMKMHEGIRDFECDLCDKKFLSKNHLKMHMDRHIKEISDKKI